MECGKKLIFELSEYLSKRAIYGLGNNLVAKVH